MKSKTCIISALIAGAACLPPAICADSQLDEFQKLVNQSYDDFAKQAREEYASFRDQVNQEYADFMREHPWTPTKIEEPLPTPINKEPEPDIEPEEEAPKPVETPKPIVIEEVVPTPEPEPQPEPIEPIEEIPVEIPVPPMIVEFYGTPVELRPAELGDFSLNGATEADFADGWLTLSKKSTNNLIADCLTVREKYNLPDWGYVKFLDALSGSLKGKGTNEQVLLQGFLLNQSGYKVRFAYDAQKKLHLLFNTKGVIYNHRRYNVDGEWYYSYSEPEGAEVYICKFGMPKEKSISMGIDKSPALAYDPAPVREITTKRHPDLKFTLSPNKNLIDFFSDYPDATLDSSPYSLWAIHGNTPVSPEIREQLYPALRKAVEGKSQLEGVQILLKVAQSFPYEFDEEIWGRDRAFWMEESWFYPYSDCEDHAVNFTQMVRDILGLDACLVYYPGHLSSCVAITDEDVKGDYIDFQGKRFIVCDPTYFYAGVGKTAPSNDNSQAILVPLRK